MGENYKTFHIESKPRQLRDSADWKRQRGTQVVGVNLPNKLGTLQEFLEENGYDDWYALFPTKASPASADVKCIFVNFKERRTAAVEIPEKWFRDPERYESVAALICFVIDDCSVPALELGHNFFFLYPHRSSESPSIFAPRHH
jgi:hypothetical protein